MKQTQIKEKQFISSRNRRKVNHGSYISIKCLGKEGDIFKNYFRNSNISLIIFWCEYDFTKYFSVAPVNQMINSV